MAVFCVQTLLSSLGGSRLVSGLFLLCVFLEGAERLTTDGYIDQVPKNYDTFRQISLMRLIDALKLCASIVQ